MRFINVIAVSLAAGLSYASPIEKRVSTPMVNDGISMNSTGPLQLSLLAPCPQFLTMP